MTTPTTNAMSIGTILEAKAETEGKAVRRANAYRTMRPKGRPKHTKGHGNKSELRDRFRPSKVMTRPVSVPAVPIPSFMEAALRGYQASR
jgi:hypothetical protein